MSIKNRILFVERLEDRRMFDADLLITKTDGLVEVRPGDSITYTIVVENHGPDAVVGARVQDVLPAGLTNVTYTTVTTGGVTGNTASGTGHINDTVNMPVSSSLVYTVAATLTHSAAGLLVNTAVVDTPVGVTDLNPANNVATDTDVIRESGTVDLVAFAQALSDAGAKFYGAAWDSFCSQQKERFEDGQNFLPFVEVTNYQTDPSRGLNEIGRARNITALPTWEFPDGTRRTGILSVEEISTLSKIAIPQSNRPILIGLGDVTVLGGSPLHVPLDAYHPNANERLTFEVTSDNPALVQPTLVSGNRHLLIDVAGFGKMNFMLFEDRARRVTDRIIDLANDRFYDGVTLHRIINDFVIQGGDPTGTGAGGSTKGDFDDQYHVDLQHNRTGVLSMAKAGDDTNDSQFFIAEGLQRHLDFNHSVFGQLIEGENNRAAISDANSPQSRPDPQVVMKSVSIFNDTENGLVMLRSPEGASGQANVTATVRDEQGHSYSQTFVVSVTPDSRNGGPYLEDLPKITMTSNTAVQFQLPAVDVEGDPVRYSGTVSGGTVFDLIVDPTSGLVTIIPPPDFVGQLFVLLRVEARDGSDTHDRFDTQMITIDVVPEIEIPPRIVASSVQNRQALFPGDLELELQFSASLDLSVLDPSDLQLIGLRNGAFSPAFFAYEQIRDALIVRYENLPVDEFQLRLISGLNGAAGRGGAFLDGELGQTTVPTGDGIPGGDFVLSFTTDRVDLDRSGTLDIGDVDILCSLIRTGIQNSAFDFDLTGIVDRQDMAKFLDLAFSTSFGDANLDGVFDSGDLVLAFQAGEYEDGQAGNSTWAEGDWDCDGDFGTGDLVQAFQTGDYEAFATALSPVGTKRGRGHRVAHIA